MTALMRRSNYNHLSACPTVIDIIGDLLTDVCQFQKLLFDQPSSAFSANSRYLAAWSRR
jgi:hypothetical protein